MMEEMENKETKTRKLTKAQIEAKEEKARQKIAFNLDNYQLVTDTCLGILQVEDTSPSVKDRANEVLMDVLNKISKL